MIRYLAVRVFLSLAYSLPAQGGIVAEPCWQNICTGMTISEVQKELRSQGFRIDHNLVERVFRRMFPMLSGGSMDFERYSVHIAGNRKDTQVNLSFVRFPSGRKRLYHFGATHTFERGQVRLLEALEQLNDEVSVDVGDVGSPEAMKWEDWPAHLHDTTNRSILRFVWPYEGGRPYFGAFATISGNIATEGSVLLDGEAPKNPEELQKVFVKSATVFFGSVVGVAMEASSAWNAKSAGWIIDEMSGCKLWNNFPQGGDEEVRWSGECNSRGKADGLGISTWSTYGTAYETDKGTFVDGRLNGTVEIEIGKSYETKTIFSGEFGNNLPNGYGVLLRDGEEFAGDWKDGCLQIGKHSVAFFTHRDACTPF